MHPAPPLPIWLMAGATSEINIINMVKHVILWTLNPELSTSEKQSVKDNIKQGLEALVGVVPGLIDLKVVTEHLLDSSSCDLMLDSTLDSEAALHAYASHPAHVAVAEAKVKPFTVQRVCIDFNI